MSFVRLQLKICELNSRIRVDNHNENLKHKLLFGFQINWRVLNDKLFARIQYRSYADGITTLEIPHEDIILSA